MTKYNRNPKVSIIIPIYNAQMHLKRCIDSVLKQDFEDFELLLMDDGSKDSSPEICDEYKKKDGRVIVVHKDNSGVSDTRNMAISLARGEYLQFLDSDDWITPDMYEKLDLSSKKDKKLLQEIEDEDCE